MSNNYSIPWTLFLSLLQAVVYSILDASLGFEASWGRDYKLSQKFISLSFVTHSLSHGTTFIKESRLPVTSEI